MDSTSEDTSLPISTSVEVGIRIRLFLPPGPVVAQLKNKNTNPIKNFFIMKDNIQQN